MPPDISRLRVAVPPDQRDPLTGGRSDQTGLPTALVVEVSADPAPTGTALAILGIHPARTRS